ncbi:MAG: hypothetical protein IKS78_06600 [Clostridia bacterium]|nr:hypothetical protein [Clostridia bacterium]
MTFFETAGQARCFLLLWGAGFLAAVLYDGFRFLRSRCPRWLGPVLDFIWGLCLCAGCALALAAGGERALRLYALLGLCCGAAVYCLGPRAACAAAMKWGRRRK